MLNTELLPMSTVSRSRTTNFFWTLQTDHFFSFPFSVSFDVFSHVCLTQLKHDRRRLRPAMTNKKKFQVRGLSTHNSNETLFPDNRQPKITLSCCERATQRDNHREFEVEQAKNSRMFKLFFFSLLSVCVRFDLQAVVVESFSFRPKENGFCLHIFIHGITCLTNYCTFSDEKKRNFRTRRMNSFFFRSLSNDVRIRFHLALASPSRFKCADILLGRAKTRKKTIFSHILMMETLSQFAMLNFLFIFHPFSRSIDTVCWSI